MKPITTYTKSVHLYGYPNLNKRKQLQKIEKEIIKHVDEAEINDLLKSDGIIVGSPTHCGLLSWKLKRFFDERTEEAWGKVKGKIGAAF